MSWYKILLPMGAALLLTSCGDDLSTGGEAKELTASNVYDIGYGLCRSRIEETDQVCSCMAQRMADKLPQEYWRYWLLVVVAEGEVGSMDLGRIAKEAKLSRRIVESTKMEADFIMASSFSICKAEAMFN